MLPTVRDAAFDVLREHGLTTLFANPGSTEIELLADLPADLRFVLGLHESSVVGMATGFAIGRGEPALAILHTTPGLGNAVSALATARVNRVPLVVVVGQQDRRHIASEPFLTGRLQGLAGDYPVWADLPLRAQSVPASIARAYHEAVTGRGPALVIVPMDDWGHEASPPEERAAPRRVVRARAADAALVEEVAGVVDRAKRPALVGGAGIDDADSWAAVVALSERLACPVWQESFSGRAGFPQDHPLFAGHLPADRQRLRETLAPSRRRACRRSTGVQAVRLRARAVRGARDDGRRRQPGSRRGASQHRRPGRARAPWDRLRRARTRRRGAGHSGSVAVRASRAPRPAGERRSRFAPGTCSRRSPNGLRRTRSSSRSPRRTAPSSSPACRRDSRSAC